MKATRRYQRRNVQGSGPGISLFPFLAVLICTMGALVPLLMAISRTARLQAEAAAIAKIAQQSGEVQTQREDVRWRIDQLKQSRVKTESQLADARLELGHIEDHSRRLRNQLAQYERTLGDLEKSANNDQQKANQSQAELEQVRTQLKTAEQQLAKAHQDATGRSQSYAVVPYEGPNQTRRRPIYLECRADAVVLQPEGIALKESDFEGPLGPGNPLAAMLRAAREYMLAQRDFDPQAGEPYPMLLVRPEGIAAYYAAREAMKSWGFDFGYELVDDTWKLAYPPPDARLADVIRQTIASARVSQARLIASAPRQYEKHTKVVYRAAPSGGFIRETVPASDNDYSPATPAGLVGGERGDGGRGTRSGGSDAGGDGMGGSRTGGDGTGSGGTGYAGGVPATSQNPLAASQPNQANGNAAGFPGNGSNSGSAGVGNSNGALNNGPALTGNGTAMEPAGSPLRSAGTGGSGIGDGSRGQPYASNPYRFAGQNPGTMVPGGTAGSGGVGSAGIGGNESLGSQSGGVSNAAGNTFGSPGNASGVAGNASGAVGSASGVAGNAASATGNPSGTPGNAATSGTANPCLNAPQSGSPGERPEGYVVGQPPREQPTQPAQPVSSEPPPADAPRSFALRPGEWQPTPEPPPTMPKDRDDKNDEDEKKRDKPKQNLVERRGVDWGLRDAARGSVGVTRPIRVECFSDRLVIISGGGSASNDVIPLGPRTISSIDTFISGVWAHMESWGMAGRGMYWRPLLEVHVAPGAEQRFADLSALLEGSGMMVERK